MKQYIAYVRVSTNKQEYGLEGQLTEINNYIANKNDGVIVKTYQEKDSGKNNNRIELKKAMDYAKSINGVLIVSKMDRLSRSAKFLFDLHDSKLDFVIVDNPNLTTLTLGIYATMAQHEREIISARTKAGLKVAKSKGKIIGRVKDCNNTTTHKDNISSSITLTHKTRLLNIVNFINSNIKTHKNNISVIVDLLNNNGFKTAHNKAFTIRGVKNILNNPNILSSVVSVVSVIV